MKKIALNEKEIIVYKIKWAKRILLFDFCLIIIFSAIISRLDVNVPLYSILSLITTLFIYAPLIIKTIFNLLRITTHRIYITNERVIIVKGYFFKRIKLIKLNDIIAVYYRIKFFDKKMKIASLKFEDKYHNHYVIKGITYANYIADLLSEHIKKRVL